MSDSQVVLTVAVTLLLLTVAALTWWGRRPPYVPKQQEERLHAIADANGTATFTGRAVVPIEPVVISLARLRDTGGYVGHIHRDCLTARRDGGEICPECLPRFQPRVGAS